MQQASSWPLWVIWDTASRTGFPIRWWFSSAVPVCFLSFGQCGWAGPVSSSGKLWGSLCLWAELL